MAVLTAFNSPATSSNFFSYFFDGSSAADAFSGSFVKGALPAHPDDVREEVILKGEVPSAFNPPSGCRFHPRCPQALPVCAEAEPILRDRASSHQVACHLYGA